MKPEVIHRKDRGPSQTIRRQQAANAEKVADEVLGSILTRLDGLKSDDAYAILHKLGIKLTKQMYDLAGIGRCMGSISKASETICETWRPGKAKSAEAEALFRGRTA